jgi:hypothetical protein
MRQDRAAARGKLLPQTQRLKIFAPLSYHATLRPCSQFYCMRFNVAALRPI